jgi:hypothetical protein
MNSSGNIDGLRQHDHDRRCQQQWATAAQWAAGRQSNCDGRWDSGGVIEGTMGGGQSPVDDGTKMGAMLGFGSVGEL